MSWVSMGNVGGITGKANLGVCMLINFRYLSRRRSIHTNGVCWVSRNIWCGQPGKVGNIGAGLFSLWYLSTDGCGLTNGKGWFGMLSLFWHNGKMGQCNKRLGCSGYLSLGGSSHIRKVCWVCKNILWNHGRVGQSGLSFKANWVLSDGCENGIGQSWIIQITGTTAWRGQSIIRFRPTGLLSGRPGRLWQNLRMSAHGRQRSDNWHDVLCNLCSSCGSCKGCFKSGCLFKHLLSERNLKRFRGFMFSHFQNCLFENGHVDSLFLNIPNHITGCEQGFKHFAHGHQWMFNWFPRIAIAGLVKDVADYPSDLQWWCHLSRSRQFKTCWTNPRNVYIGGLQTIEQCHFFRVQVAHGMKGELAKGHVLPKWDQLSIESTISQPGSCESLSAAVTLARFDLRPPWMSCSSHRLTHVDNGPMYTLRSIIEGTKFMKIQSEVIQLFTR